MSTINTESLFHYTTNLSVLKIILEKGLKFTYCKETFGGLVWGIPMVCFCDIPISRAFQHKNKYGGFALGLSKKSLLEGDGTKNYFNPVMYIHSDGVSKGLMRLYKIVEQYHTDMNKLTQNSSKVIAIDAPPNHWCSGIKSAVPIDSNTAKQIFNNFGIEKDRDMLFGYSKPYISKGKRGEDVINYYEREWRAILPETDKYKWLRNKDDCDLWRGQTGSPKKFLDVAITFSVEDINHILVPTEKCIPSIVKFIGQSKQIGGHNLDEEQRGVLATKITSFERIESDF